LLKDICGKEQTGAKEQTVWGDDMSEQSARRRGWWSWWYLLFVVQVVAVVWVPFYNRLEPTFIGLPFFYWYQLGWVIVGAIATAIVYFAVRD
jgi:hypothetical protein